VKRLLLLLTACGAALSVGACGDDRRALADDRHVLMSCRETAAMLADGWLSGDLSTTYTRTALDTTARLLAERQSALAVDLSRLATPEGRSLSQSEERLSGRLASLSAAVGAADATAARRGLAGLKADP
jgi:hypothetical protein